MTAVKGQITLVVGARPNFMKAAPLLAELKKSTEFPVRLVHTGQHFDESMSKAFFDQLQLPEPDTYLGINQTDPTTLIANVMLGLQEEFSKYPPNLVVVFGDVNSTLAAAIAANKMNLLLAHVEAGLRSFDRGMPEEHNRIAVDMLADYLFTPSADADENLLNEGVSAERIFRVGNIMVDSLFAHKQAALQLNTYESFGVTPRAYALVTLHRPSNVDDLGALEEIIAALTEVGKEIPVIFPAHPRTRAQLLKFKPEQKLSNGLKIVDPLSYLEFLNLMLHARVVLTDSGGIQEETTALGIPCLTLRDNTERPITIAQGTNRLAGNKKDSILSAFREISNSNNSKGAIPELWDGKTAERIVLVLREKFPDRSGKK